MTQNYYRPTLSLFTTQEERQNLVDEYEAKLRKSTEKERSIRDELEKELDGLKGKLADKMDPTVTSPSSPPLINETSREKGDDGNYLEIDGKDITEMQLIAITEEMERMQQVLC